MLTALGIIDMRTPVAGASSGSLVAGFSCANVSEADYKAGFQKMSDFCRAHHNCQLILDEELRPTVQGFLPPAAFKTCASCCDNSMSACSAVSKAPHARTCATAAARTCSCTNVGSLTITVGDFPPKQGLTRGVQVGCGTLACCSQRWCVRACTGGAATPAAWRTRRLGRFLPTTTCWTLQ